MTLPENPFFVDLVHGVVGRFHKAKPASGEDVVIPVYSPYGGWKTVDYRYKIPADALAKIQPESDMPGTPREIVFLTEKMGGGRPVAKKLNELIEDGISRQQKRMRDERFRWQREHRERKQSEDLFDDVKRDRQQRPPRRRSRDDSSKKRKKRKRGKKSKNNRGSGNRGSR